MSILIINKHAHVVIANTQFYGIYCEFLKHWYFLLLIKNQINSKKNVFNDLLL